MMTMIGRPYRTARRCCILLSLSSLSIQLLIVLIGVILTTAPTTTLAQVIVPPADEASYSQQCGLAPSITLDETVPITFTNGSIVVWIDPTDNSTQRHPQQGAVLMCDSTTPSSFYSIGTHKNQWYAIRGNGQVLTASTTCGGVPASITVYQDQCPTLQCALNDSRGCPGLCIDTAIAASVESRMTSTATNNCGTSVSWVSQINRTYYIQVWQYYDVLGGIRSPSDPILEPCGGTTTLTVTQSMVPTHYNSCPNAQSLAMSSNTTTPVVVVGNVTLVIVQECSPNNAAQPGIGGAGLWYTLLGNGRVWYVETCNGVLLSMFTGSTCQQLSCFDDFVMENVVVDNGSTASDGGTSQQCSRITFYSINGQRYYMYASGPGTLHPSFRLAAQETNIVTPAIHNRCSNATRFVADGVPITLSFDTAVHSELRPDQSFVDVTPTLWYQLNGTGNVYTVKVCPPVSPNLFTGNCTHGIDRYDLMKSTIMDDQCMSFRFQSDVTLQYLFAFRNSDQGTVYNVTLWEENAQVLPLYSTSCEYAIGPLWYNSSSVSIAKFVNATIGGGGAATTNLMKTIFIYANRPKQGNLLRGRVCRRRTTTSNVNFNFDIVLKVTMLELCHYATISSTGDAGTLVGPIDENGCRSISWRSDSWNTATPLLIVVSAMDVMDIDIAIWQESASILPLNDRPPETYWLEDNATKNYPRISVGTTIVGTTVNAHADLPWYGPCSNVRVNQPDVWYIVRGDGRELEACVRDGNSNNNSASSSFGALAVVTELVDIDAVFKGCVPNAKYGTVPNCPISVRWKTTIDEIYTLLVQTAQPNAFELSLWNVSDAITTTEWQYIAPPPPIQMIGSNNSMLTSNNSALVSSSVAPEMVTSGVVSFRNCCGYKLVALAALMHSLFLVIIA